jgi:adenosylhomocysteine nucleosidase
VEPFLDVAASQDASPHVAIFAALRQELSALERGMEAREESTAGNLRLLRGQFHGHEILLAQTGPGRENAQEAASFVLGQYSPRVAVCVGFAGALTAELEGRDLVVCESLYRLDEHTNLSTPLTCDERLVKAGMEASRSAGLHLRRGNSLTVDEEASAPGSKAALGRLGPVHVVEMENYWLALEAGERGVPFVAVRAISDTVDQALPEGCSFVDQRGEARAGKVVVHALRHPRSVVVFLKLAANARRCTSNLTAFAVAFLDLLG